MSLDYSAVQEGLEAVKVEIDNLVGYIKANQSRPDTDSVDLNIYAQLAEISTSVLKCDHELVPKSEVKCSCGDCELEGNYYVCAGCKRTVPWCFGAADKYFDYCDDCAVRLADAEEFKSGVKKDEVLLGDK